MKNVTERFSHGWLVGEIRFLVTVVVFLITSISSTLAVALGPVDGDGLVPTDLERVKIGNQAPDFTLEAENGTPISLSQFRNKQPVILVFYRGHW